MQETVSGLTPSPNLSPKGERNMRARGVGGYAAAVIKPASAEIVAL